MNDGGAGSYPVELAPTRSEYTDYETALTLPKRLKKGTVLLSLPNLFGYKLNLPTPLLAHQKQRVAEQQLAALPEGAEQGVVAEVDHRAAAQVLGA